MRIDYFRNSIGLSWAVIFLIVLFWVLLFLDGVSQHYFQSFHPIDEYILKLERSVEGLRRSVLADNHFIVFYTCGTFFFLLGLWRPGNGAVIGLSMACYLATGFIDLSEGMLYLVMGDAVLAGTPPTEGLVFFFAWAAMLKWHLVYVGMFVMTFVIPPQGFAANAMIWGGRLLLLPAGILVYTVDPEMKPTMLLVRFVLVVLSYLLTIAIARQQINLLKKNDISSPSSPPLHEGTN